LASGIPVAVCGLASPFNFAVEDAFTTVLCTFASASRIWRAVVTYGHRLVGGVFYRQGRRIALGAQV